LNKETGVSRRFDAVIIDEVDSMLIDDNNTLARLADQLPGMEWLNPLLFGIWSSVDADKQAESKRDTIIDNARKLLTDPKSDLKLPTHLVRFIDDSIPTWVDHALLAKFEYRLDHHYMIKPDETRTKRIMPIDFSNTGVVQPSTTWSDGLHQFLQIKHGLKMTALTVTTNYLSNMGLFTRYGKNIFGLTGTIGSEDAQKLLYRIYTVDTVIIPPFKQKRHIQLKTTLCENDDEWLQTIVAETISNARKQRGILVICETRLDAKTISKQLQRADPTCVVRLYTDNTDAVESDVVGNRIQPGEIIVATNLAGRGTDLKTSPTVEKNGGLHV
jgi:preprotein translocase subunit SecA